MSTREGGDDMRYGYVDLHSTSANGELRWVHIRLQQIRFPFPVRIEFAVDHNLVAVNSQPSDRATVDVSFFEFTTGAFHPLSSKSTVRLKSPLNPVPAVVGLESEVLGDYVLVSVTYDYTGCFSPSFHGKRGLQHLQITEWRKVPKIVAIDNNLIAIVEDNTNSIEICRLELSPLDVRIKTVISHRKGVDFNFEASPEIRISPKSFYSLPSSKVGSIRFFLDYHILSEGVYKDYPYTMILSVADLLDDIDTNRRSVPWIDWGPARTRIFPRERFPPCTAGPFWISYYSPLTIRDYNLLRAQWPSSATESSSYLGSPVCHPSKAVGEQWVGGAVETCLPFREFIIPNLRFNLSRQVVADREWLVDISRDLIGCKYRQGLPNGSGPGHKFATRYASHYDSETPVMI
ncbi:hypothetical protein EI94DRAFT_1700043 [Lactarius quietus]|nr:hypothetical protein EI94DRAFT_1700043 [Lactarius quietus]